MTNISYIAAFIAGLLSFFSPCVLPLIPSYISIITGVAFNDLQEKDVYYKKTAEDAIGGAVTIFPVDVWGKAQKDDFVIKSDYMLCYSCKYQRDHTCTECGHVVKHFSYSTICGTKISLG